MSQWSNYGKPDPLVPFDEGRLNKLKDNLRVGANDSADVIGRMQRLVSQGGQSAWTGSAPDAFFAEIDELREDLIKLMRSYGLAHAAVNIYVGDLKRLRMKSDSLLADITGYELRVHAQEQELQALQPEEDGSRLQIETAIETDRQSLNWLVGQSAGILSELDDSAGEFRTRMWDAQDIGIHNRPLLERWYQDSFVDFMFEGMIERLGSVGSWLTVAGYIAAITPIPGFRLVALVLLGSAKVLGAVAVGLKTIDILLSDDDADLEYFLVAGMTVVGFGGPKISSTFPNSQAGRYANVIVKYVDVVEGASAGVDVVEQIHAYDTEVPHQQIEPHGTRASQEFGDPTWNLARPTLNQLMTTPTLVETEVDVLPLIPENWQEREHIHD